MIKLFIDINHFYSTSSPGGWSPSSTWCSPAPAATPAPPAPPTSPWSTPQNPPFRKKEIRLSWTNCSFFLLCSDCASFFHSQHLFIRGASFWMYRSPVLHCLSICTASDTPPYLSWAVLAPWGRMHSYHKCFQFCTFKKDPTTFRRTMRQLCWIHCGKYHCLLCA